MTITITTITMMATMTNNITAISKATADNKKQHKQWTNNTNNPLTVVYMFPSKVSGTSTLSV